MKTYILRIFAAFLILTLIFSALPVVTQAQQGCGELEISEFYGRQALSEMERGDKLIKVYDLIYKGIENREEEISFGEVGISCGELTMIMSAYQNDPHPHFWVNAGYSYSYYSYSHAVSVSPKYNALVGNDDSEFARYKENFDDAVDALLEKADITSNMSDFEKERRIHDTLALTITYVSSAANAHNIYGAIVDKECVCQGYTYAFQYLLRLVGIQAHSVIGTANGGAHSWNLVRIDGEYYFADLTWDTPEYIDEVNPEQSLYYNYFNVTAEQLSLSHSWVAPAYGLPDCKATAASYFERNPRFYVSSSCTPAEIAALFKNGWVRVYVTDTNTEDFDSWYYDNSEEIARLAGYDMNKGCIVSASSFQREYHLCIYGTLIEPEFVCGDLDGDGGFNAVDSNMLRRIVSGKSVPTRIQELSGDLDGDSLLTGKDSNLLKRLIAGN